jgi:nucleotide-binding universal stress UspA family protein
VDLAIEVRAGRPALEIVEFAEQEEADLIVMASHGLTGLRHLLLGSVTEQVIRRAPCPIFTVKAFGKTLV